jgi:hypothetical protein
MTEAAISAPDRMAVVARVYNPPELAILLSVLEDHGIWVQPDYRQQIGVHWDWALALGGVLLRVRAEDAPAAYAALAAAPPAVWRGGVFTDVRVLDVALAILILLWCGVGVPCRLPAEFVLERPAAARPVT